MNNTSDRRRSPRVEPRGPVLGEIPALGLAVRVREVSLGGMSVETAQRLDVGVRTDFALRLGDGSVVEIAADVVYCRPGDVERPGTFVSGVKFFGNDEADPAGPGPDLVSKVS